MARRRQKGDGSAYQDKDGQWWAKLPIGNKRYRRARCADAKDAETTLKRLRTERDEYRVDLRASQQSVQMWLQKFLTAKAESVQPSTLAFYKRHCEYMLPYIGHLKLEALETHHVRAMLIALRRAGLSPRSCAHVHTVLHTALEIAVKDHAVRENVVKNVDTPRVGEYEAHVLSMDELEKLEQACQGERLGLAIILAATLGLRRGELLGLRWADIDDESQTLRIVDSKTKAGRRMLPLTDNITERLHELWKVRQEERQLPHWREHTLIFPSEVGTPMSPRNLLRVFKRILRKAGLSEAIRFHDLRHTAITDWIASGADPKSAQALAGHADAQTTMRIYAKARAEGMRDVIENTEKRRKKRSG